MPARIEQELKINPLTPLTSENWLENYPLANIEGGLTQSSKNPSQDWMLYTGLEGVMFYTRPNPRDLKLELDSQRLKISRRTTITSIGFTPFDDNNAHTLLSGIRGLRAFFVLLEQFSDTLAEPAYLMAQTDPKSAHFAKLLGFQTDQRSKNPQVELIIAPIEIVRQKFELVEQRVINNPTLLRQATRSRIQAERQIANHKATPAIEFPTDRQSPDESSGPAPADANRQIERQSTLKLGFAI